LIELCPSTFFHHAVHSYQYHNIRQQPVEWPNQQTSNRRSSCRCWV